MCVVNSYSQVFLLTLFSRFLLLFDLLLLRDFLPVHSVLLLVEGRPSFGIHKPIVRNQLLLELRLELDHLLKRDHVVLTAAVKPELEHHLAVDFVTVSELVAVHLKARELVVSDQYQLPAQIRNLVRVALEDHVEEGSPITSALAELFRAQSCSGNENVRCLHQDLNIIHLSKLGNLLVHLGLSG